MGLVVDLETGVEGGLHGGSGRRGVGAFGPDRTFVVPVVEADVGEAGAGDAGVGAAAGKAVAGVGDGEGGEAERHGSAKLPDRDWSNRADVGWDVNWVRAKLGVSRAVRVFSKKLLRRRGVFFGGVWRRGARTGFRLNTPEWRVGCGGMLFGGDWGAVEHNDWMHIGPARPGVRRWVGRAWLDGGGRKARGRRANVGRRGTNGGRASGGRRAAIGGARRRTGSRPSADGIKRRRRASSRSRSEAAGIWRSGCEAYSDSVHYPRTPGKGGVVARAQSRRRFRRRPLGTSESWSMRPSMELGFWRGLGKVAWERMRRWAGGGSGRRWRGGWGCRGGVVRQLGRVTHDREHRARTQSTAQPEPLDGLGILRDPMYA